MKIALLSSCVPFINGGARFIVEWLEEELLTHGHQVERFYLPFSDGSDRLIDQLAAYRLMDLTHACDRLIAFRPPAYGVRHPHKRLWFIHHIRVYYDLWDKPHGKRSDVPRDVAHRAALRDYDTATLGEARAIYTNSKVVSKRLEAYNGLKSRPLYPPLYKPERFRCDGYGDEILAVSRVEPHKRQDLMIEAMAHVRTPVRLRLCGRSASPAYGAALQARIQALGLQDRISFEDRWISEAEKADLLASALGAAYLPHDEDSYGYPSLEAAHALKAVVTTTDAGGVLELVEDRRNGLVVAPEPRALAEAFDRLWRDRDAAARLGQ
uniref:glycosyltransferase family 4 protein n=1 Tax=uncultured Phenylobacterium sp. TaxID=349273 RepID=UPI0025DE4FD3